MHHWWTPCFSGNNAQIIEVAPHDLFQVFWLHNGKPVAPDGRVEIMVEPPRLTIHHLNKDDKGMYQCFVSNDWDQAQAVAQLDMGDAGPELIYWFVLKNI